MKFDKWYGLALVVVLILAALLVWRRGQVLPWGYADMSFHLATAQGFVRAGGPVTWSFWEAVPEGRPHNYPPLFHIVMAGFLSLGWSPDLVAQTAIWLALVGGGAIFAWGLARLYGVRIALITTLLLLATVRFLGYSAMILPATLAVFLSPLLLLSLIHRRWLALWALLVLELYLHLFIPYVIVAVLLLWCYRYARSSFSLLSITLAAALVAYAPWLVHIVTDGLGFIKYFGRDFYIQNISPQIWSVNLIVFPLYFLGTILLIRRAKPASAALLFFVWLGLAWLPLGAFFPGRSLTAHAFAAAAPVAAWALVQIASRRWGVYVAAAVFMLALYGAPYLNWPPRPRLLTFVNSTWRVVGNWFVQDEVSFKTGVARVVQLIGQHSQRGETVASLVERFQGSPVVNIFQVSAADYFAARAGRPTVNLREPEVYSVEPQISSARIILASRPLAEIDSLKSASPLTLIVDPNKEWSNFVLLEQVPFGMGENIYLYYNQSKLVASEQPVAPLVPLPLAISLIAALIAVVWVDLWQLGQTTPEDTKSVI